MTPLEEAIGHTFSDRTLLARALTRLAYAHEQGLPGDCHMDALAVLEMPRSNLLSFWKLLMLAGLIKG